MGARTIVIPRRFRGPEHSGNGGYCCGRVAEFVDGPARVRLHVPPPLDVPLEVRISDDGVRVFHQETMIAEAWSIPGLDVQVPPPPTAEQAERASKNYSGFFHHRYPTCFVCGVDREPGDGLRLFAGPLSERDAGGDAGRDLVACTWVPDRSLSGDGVTIAPVFAWSALDCPGGFAFPHPQHGTILLGELAVHLFEPVAPGERLVITGWEFGRQGRKHFTGTALFSALGTCLGVGQATWFEVLP